MVLPDGAEQRDFEEDEMGYQLRGTYLTHCDCMQICPCSVDEKPTGRDGQCHGLVVVNIDNGSLDDTDLSGTRGRAIGRPARSATAGCGSGSSSMTRPPMSRRRAWNGSSAARWAAGSGIHRADRGADRKVDRYRACRDRVLRRRRAVRHDRRNRGQLHRVPRPGRQRHHGPQRGLRLAGVHPGQVIRPIRRAR